MDRAKLSAAADSDIGARLLAAISRFHGHPSIISFHQDGIPPSPACPVCPLWSVGSLARWLVGSLVSRRRTQFKRSPRSPALVLVPLRLSSPLLALCTLLSALSLSTSQSLQPLPIRSRTANSSPLSRFLSFLTHFLTSAAHSPDHLPRFPSAPLRYNLRQHAAKGTPFCDL